MKKRMIAMILALTIFAALLPVTAYAASASAKLDGPGTVRAGDTIKVSFVLSGSNLTGAEGALSYDSNQLTLTGTTQVVSAPWVVEFNGNKFVAYDNNLTSPINGSATLFTATFTVKSLAVGTNITVSCTGVKATDGTADAQVGTVQYKVSVAAPLATDNALQSLSVSNATISPAFSPDVTGYTAQVPFEVSKLQLSAAARDAKASVSVNNPTLTPNATTKVTVTVTAENGSKKTYTIAVTRAQNPNYVPNNNSKLASLSVEGFLLSPVFDQNKTQYVVWVPYEVESVAISGKAEDALANVKVEGGDALKAGADNPVQVICTAEDGSKTVYTVNVKRGPAHEPGQEPTEPNVEPDTPEPTKPVTVPTETTQPPATEAPTVQEQKSGSAGVIVLLILLAFAAGIGCGFAINYLLRKKK